MTRVAVVIDSTAYIPEAMMKENDIHIVPLNVIFGDEIFLDGVDMVPQTFYSRLSSSKIMPSTSQPSPDAFKIKYKELLDKGYQIISMHISSNLSGTVNSAMQAKNEVGNGDIEVIDSKLTSMALGFPVLTVARAAREGATLKECKAIAENAISKSGAIFAVNTLEFLHRGGRIGSAAAFMGTALNLKPVLHLEDGKIEALEKIRTMTKAMDRVVQILGNQVKNTSSLHLAAIHSNVPGEAQKLLDKARNAYTIAQVQDAVVADISPVIGTHTGPGTVGLAFMFE